MKNSVFILIISLFLFSCDKESIKVPSHLSVDYCLVWNDEFDGDTIDSLKWDYRYPGTTRGYGVVAPENTYVDGDGHLVIEVTKKGDEYKIGQVGTHNTYSTQFGYFECRAKMNSELGPHVAFWLQAPTMGKEDNNPQVNGTEIDIFEYHVKGSINTVYHNLHWNGYGAQHQHVGTTVEIDGMDSGFHVFGLEWNENEYIFYVDGEETWRTTEAVSHRTEYMILSAELSGWGGDFSRSVFPDKVIFDYVRVFQRIKDYDNSLR